MPLFWGLKYNYSHLDVDFAPILPWSPASQRSVRRRGSSTTQWCDRGNFCGARAPVLYLLVAVHSFCEERLRPAGWRSGFLVSLKRAGEFIFSLVFEGFCRTAPPTRCTCQSCHMHENVNSETEQMWRTASNPRRRTKREMDRSVNINLNQHK